MYLNTYLSISLHSTAPVKDLCFPLMRFLCLVAFSCTYFPLEAV